MTDMTRVHTCADAHECARERAYTHEDARAHKRKNTQAQSVPAPALAPAPDPAPAPTHSHIFSPSRKAFLKICAAGSALAGLALSQSGCKRKSGNADVAAQIDDSRAEYIIDPKTNESNYTYADFSLQEKGSWEIPLGNILRPSSGSWIAATTAGTSATPVIKGSAFSLESGKLIEVLKEPYMKKTPNFVIFDVSCSDEIYAWLEFDTIEKGWYLFASAFSKGALTGEVTELWHADENYAPAKFVVSGKHVIWQVTPYAKKKKARESATLYLWSLGQAQADAILESKGAFATAPTISGDVVVVVPRLAREGAGVAHVMQAYSISSGIKSVVDEFAMPSGVAPQTAVYINNHFVFSVAANHQQRGLLGKMGTYIACSDGSFVVLSREPSAACAGSKNTIIIRSKVSYFVVDIENKSYSILAASPRTSDVGEFPCVSGESRFFITYATLKDKDTGYPKNIFIRRFII